MSDDESRPATFFVGMTDEAVGIMVELPDGTVVSIELSEAEVEKTVALLGYYSGKLRARRLVKQRSFTPSGQSSKIDRERPSRLDS